MLCGGSISVKLPTLVLQMTAPNMVKYIPGYVLDTRGKPEHSPHCRCQYCYNPPELLEELRQVTRSNPDQMTDEEATRYTDVPLPSNWPPGYWKALKNIAEADTTLIRNKEHTYQGSWKKRGGQGAFFTIARPIDRYDKIAEQGGYDLFAILQKEIDEGRSGDDGSLMATIRDIRCYLLLLETEMHMRKKADNYQVGSPHPTEPTTIYCKPADADLARRIINQ